MAHEAPGHEICTKADKVRASGFAFFVCETLGLRPLAVVLSLSLSLSLSLYLSLSRGHSVRALNSWFLFLAPHQSFHSLTLRSPEGLRFLLFSPVSWLNKVRSREPSLLQQEVTQKLACRLPIGNPSSRKNLRMFLQILA